LQFIVSVQAGRIHSQTGVADSGICLGALASQLTGWTDVDAATAKAAFFGTDIERCGDFSFVSSVLKADGTTIHLFLTHTDT